MLFPPNILDLFAVFAELIDNFSLLELIVENLLEITPCSTSLRAHIFFCRFFHLKTLEAQTLKLKLKDNSNFWNFILGPKITTKEELLIAIIANGLSFIEVIVF